MRPYSGCDLHVNRDVGILYLCLLLLLLPTARAEIKKIEGLLWHTGDSSYPVFSVRIIIIGGGLGKWRGY